MASSMQRSGTERAPPSGGDANPDIRPTSKNCTRSNDVERKWRNLYTCSRRAKNQAVSLFKYNKQQFFAYPRGKDGPYGEDYLRYGYVIGEEMAFNTAHGTVRGGLGPMGMISNDADAIFVEGETVTLHRAGIDFPDESGAFALAPDEDKSA